MDCSEAKSHLSAFASGLTNDLDRTEIEEHLTSCEACALEVELLRGRASGQSSTPRPSDWTLEKIFGGDGGGESAESAEGSPAREAAPSPASEAVMLEATRAEALPPPAPPAPAAEPRPSLILPLPATPESNEDRAKTMPGGGKSKSGSWDFEPADAGKEAAPPEESLAFAEQTLNRKRDGATKSKAAAIRALAWTLGGVAGLGLLGVSVWIAMAVHQAPPRELSTGAARSTPAQDAPEADSSRGSDSSSVIPPLEEPIQARTLPGIPSSTSPPEPARAAGAPTPASTMASIARTAPPATSRSVPAPKTPAPAPSAKSAPAAPKPALDDALSTKGATPSKVSPKPLARDDDDMWPTDDPVRAGTTGSGSSAGKAPATAAPAPTPAPSAAVATPPSTSTGTTETASPSASSARREAAPPSGAAAPSTPSTPPTPIDRLHAATEKAAADRDLAALRQLKTAWKALLRTTVGRERSRTKREYADCLWAIQGITGRDADRLECLNAYREYLLSAPAGGTDARSAERLRQLEDALHESD